MGEPKRGRHVRSETGAAKPDRVRPKVLVVDHDPEATHLLAAELERWGCVAFAANNAAEAMRIAWNEHLDAALIDVQVPGMDGIRVLQALMEQHERLVVVIMTSPANLEGARRAVRLGASDYVTRPFDLKSLREALKAGLEGRDNASPRPDR